MTTINTVHTTILDLFADKLRRGHRPKIVLAVVCAVSYLLGLTMTCNVSALHTTVSKKLTCNVSVVCASCYLNCRVNSVPCSCLVDDPRTW